MGINSNAVNLSNLLKKGNPFFTLEIFSTIKLNTIKTIINNKYEYGDFIR